MPAQLKTNKTKNLMSDKSQITFSRKKIKSKKSWSETLGHSVLKRNRLWINFSGSHSKFFSGQFWPCYLPMKLRYHAVTMSWHPLWRIILNLLQLVRPISLNLIDAHNANQTNRFLIWCFKSAKLAMLKWHWMKCFVFVCVCFWGAMWEWFRDFGQF